MILIMIYVVFIRGQIGQIGCNCFIENIGRKSKVEGQL